MANKKSNHLENHAEIEREIDVLHSLDEALKDIDTSVPEGAQ